jgi:hypothetical protein
VKMEKKTEPKVSQHRAPPKPTQPIKSKGFCIDSEPPKLEKLPKPQKAAECISAEKQYFSESRRDREEQPKLEQRFALHSAKNVRKQPEIVPTRQLFPKEPMLDQHRERNLPPKSRKGSAINELPKRPPKYLSNQPKAVSMLDVTKEEETLVANLPDIVRRERESSNESDGVPRDGQRKVEFKSINDTAVAKMYEDIADSAKGEAEQNDQQHEGEEKDKRDEGEWQNGNTQNVGECAEDWSCANDNGVQMVMLNEGNTQQMNECDDNATTEKVKDESVKDE